MCVGIEYASGCRVWKRPIWNRDKESATSFCASGIWKARNEKLNFSIVATNVRTRAMMFSFDDEVELIIETRAMLSVWNSIIRFLICSPQRLTARTIGYNSGRVISIPLMLDGHTPYVQARPRTAPNPIPPAASVYSFKELSPPTMKKDLPLYWDKKVDQTLRSNLAPLVMVTWWKGFRALEQREYNRLRKARPGTIARQAKFSEPRRDCSAWSVIFFFERTFCSNCEHFCTLSFGSIARACFTSRSIPSRVRVVAGPSVLSDAMGMPHASQKAIKCLSWSFPSCSESDMMRKSSSTWTIRGMLSLFWAIHCIAVENASKIAQDMEQPIGRVVS